LNDEAIARFWTAYTEATTEHPLCRHFRLWKNCIVLEVKPGFGGTIRLSFIQSLYPREGHASRCLDWLLKLAREHGLTINGTIMRSGASKDYLTTRQLRVWYKRHGARQDARGNFTFNN